MDGLGEYEGWVISAPNAIYIIELNWIERRKDQLKHTHTQFVLYVCLIVMWYDIISVWNCCTMWTSLWKRSKSNCNSDSVSVLFVFEFEHITLREQKRERINTHTHSLTFIHFTSLKVFSFSVWIWHFHSHFDFLWTYTQSTEIKDWHQRFLKIAQRNLHNWWECVGTKIPINVLYPLSLPLSISIFSICVCFDLWNSNSHSHSHSNTYWREVKWVSLSQSVFCFHCWLLCSLIWNTQIERTLKRFVQCCNNNNNNKIHSMVISFIFSPYWLIDVW
jgi:hypothetical protein